MMKAYVFKVELEDSKPLIWRKFVVPADITFLRLHFTLQYVMGWYNSHLHKFAFEENDTYFTNDKEDIEETKFLKEHYKNNSLDPKDSSYPFIKRRLERNVYPSTPAKIDKFMIPGCTFSYEYDFGDSWIHKLTLLEILDDYKFHYPRILGGEGNCPPEDVGGIGGYEYFLQVINKIDHPQHRDFWQWAMVQNWLEFSPRDINSWMKHDPIFKKKKTVKKVKPSSTIDSVLSKLKIGQPATRALASIGITSLEQLTEMTEKELLDLHGFGPKALNLLKTALEKENLALKAESKLNTC